jgi:uncharacterized protein YjbI with pentapeptide repeats
VILEVKELVEADFRAANLQDAVLDKLTNLKGADLQEANLQGAQLEIADLQGANLRTANLHEANLSSVNLQEANSQEANLRDTILEMKTDLKGADLRETKGLVTGQLQDTEGDREHKP